ncbi:MAG: 1,4-dihydroxy-6-naphthoate synthase [Bacteroidia bacterium]|nr:1,4-dihydroxy-6-naphthoate synthase [Bacteroidia bacterium]
MSFNQPIRIGFSPCPNDTFIFDALIHQKIDTEGLTFEAVLEDVESLNKKAFNAGLEITKLSFFAYGFLSDKYQLLDAGAALGRGVGPLLISKRKINNPEIEIKTVAIPGKFTTANFLYSNFFHDVGIKKEMIFSEIENSVLSGEVDAGVIIHENRFTYLQKGLLKIADLGELWETKTGKAIPLGGIAIRRSIPVELKNKINNLLRKSVQYALDNPASVMDYVKKHAQEMDPKIMMQHIELYVNDSSIDLGTAGRDAINTFYQRSEALKLTGNLTQPIFLNSLEKVC